MDHSICKVLRRLCGRDVQYASQTMRACTIIYQPWEARQRCKTADYSSVLEEDRLCDTLGTNWASVGRWSHKRQGRGRCMPPSKFEVSHAGEAPDESEQADSNREEPDSGTVLIGLLRGTFPDWTVAWHFS